jgi:hypothetical protein
MRPRAGGRRVRSYTSASWAQGTAGQHSPRRIEPDRRPDRMVVCWRLNRVGRTDYTDVRPCGAKTRRHTPTVFVGLPDSHTSELNQAKRNRGPETFVPSVGGSLPSDRRRALRISGVTADRPRVIGCQ